MFDARILFQDYVGRLSQLYPKSEAESLVLWLFEEYLGFKKSDLAKEIQFENIPENLRGAFAKLLSGKPIQYILGKAPFYGREFFVDPSVLIPRNETEELVHWIIQENKSTNLRILDIGTGTGCIPISLDLVMRRPRVYGLDISKEALEMAKKNNTTLGAGVQFIEADILNQAIDLSELDIIVSNPPYVLESEKGQMHPNVLDHEPHLALFVANDDALLFYESIARKAKDALKIAGKLYFEINESKGVAVSRLLENLGYSNIEIRKDLNGKDRMVRAMWGGVDNFSR